jgi:cellulose synthase/poly-beta-1,6-N-acetylglucosamine synthase-like glycosyltransferase
MGFILTVIWLPLLIYISFAALYYILLSVSYFVTRDQRPGKSKEPHRYILLIPAHNEQTVIGKMLESVKRIGYDKNLLKISVIADNCIDKTAAIASDLGVDVMVRNDAAKRGKGFAIEWALKRIDLDAYEALVIADADNIVDQAFFRGLNEVIDKGYEVIQCNNCLANPDATPFTTVIHLSRTINNILYHQAKFKLGLSSYLMGNGMCFTTKILKKYGWSVSTIAEDYEYYAKLVMEGELIGFAVSAKLYHQESTGIRHATDQRIRWSSGRFQVAKTLGIGLLLKGLSNKDIRTVDASFALLLPNLSMMVNLTLMAIVLLIIQGFFHPSEYMIYWTVFILFLEFLYFSLGVFLTKIPLWRFVVALAYCPLFLLWKGIIDIIGLTGKKIARWGRAERR